MAFTLPDLPYSHDALEAGGMSREGAWLHDLALDQVHDAIGASADRVLFDRLFAESNAELQDPSLSFDLLLPDDEASIEDRAVALVEWCRHGPPSARVRELAARDAAVSGASSFEVTG